MGRAAATEMHLVNYFLTNIAAFLASLELPQYAGGFVANGVDFLAIPALERDDWTELGVPIGHRARIIKEHKALHPELW